MIIHMSLMAEKQKFSKEPLALYLCDSTTVVPDCIVIRFEVESLPQGTKDLLFNADMQDESQGATANVGAEAVREALGQRSLCDISIETYTPKADEMTYAEATSTTPSLGTAAGKKEDTPPLPRDRIAFFSGIPAVECIKGVLHLYRHRPSVDQAVSELVCILCVPAHMQLSDMLVFLSPAKANIHSLRVIRDSTPNQYMVLIKFKEKSLAEQFYSTYNGCRYNSLEKTVCQLVYVSRLEILKSSQGAALASPGLTELPSCPVCLERLDESVLTILCNHCFHTDCLTRWEDSTCPVCRYTQTPEPSGDNMCFSCDSKEDLWICLICGHIGCGRYVGGHSRNHFVETQHTFSMQLGTQRVWDYIGDNYVHRLVQNKEDGKLVEVAGQGGMIADDEKIDSLQLEYTYLLTSQLESQRLFFEEKLLRVEKEANDKLTVMESRCRSAVMDKEKLEEYLMELEREKKSNEKKAVKLQAKVAKLTAELKEEKEMNKCLSDNQKAWRDRVSELEKKIDVTIQQKEQEMRELQDQVRDLMFYLETQKKIADTPEETRQEIQEGQVVVTQGASGGGGTHTRKPRKKK